MKPVLIYLRPLDQKTGQRLDVRVADGPSADTYGTAGTVWEPALITRPTLSIELMSPDMDGKVQAGQARFDIALGQMFTIAAALRLYWRGASVVIHNTGVLEGNTAIPDFWGYVTSARLDLDSGRLNVTAEVSTAFIDKPLLTGEFTGGGGIDGDAAKRGVLYPAGFGSVKNIQPVWFDLTRNIGMIDGYANTIAIDWLGEGLSSFGARVADYPTYAALAAAIDNKTIKPGQWGTCVAQGLVGLGAPPTGIITVHARFGSNRLGAMMKRILLTHAKVPVARVQTGAFDALDAAVDRPVHFWTDAQRNVKDLLEALAQSCNATPLVSFQNQVTVTRAVTGAEVATLNRSGGVEPRVIDWQSADVDPPYYLLKARVARPAMVLSDDQVNYTDTLEDKGVYAAATVYRQGNLVWLADGSQWLYQNADPSSGHAPPTAAAPDGNGYVQDAWWFRRQPPKKATDFTYNDGTTLEALKPRQAGGDPTANNTAAAISGQGPGATAAAADVFNNYVKMLADGTLTGGGGGKATYGGLGGKALGLLDNMFFGSSYLLESNDGAIASLNAFKTALGTASAITGQGSLATLSALAYGSSYLTGFGAIAALSALSLGGSYLKRSDGTTNLTDALVITALGTAAALAGQGALATLSAISGDTHLSGILANRLAGFSGDTNYLRADRMAWLGGATVESLKPGELGSNKTETRTAAAFSGQGALATLSAVGTAQILANAITGSRIAIGDKSNLIADPVLIDPDSWGGFTAAGAQLIAAPANSGYASVNYLRVPVNSQQAGVVSKHFPVEGGNQYRISVIIATGNPTQLGWTGFLWYSDPNGATFLSETVVGYKQHGGFENAAQARNQFTATAPAGAMSGRIHFTRGAGGPGALDFAEPIVRRATSYDLLTGDAVRLGGNVRRANGTTLVNDIDAITALGTAAALAGQGALATLSALALGSAYLTGFGSLASRENVKIGSGNSGSGMLYTETGLTTSDNILLTALGTAAAFAGQGWFATQSSVDFGDDTRLVGATKPAPNAGTTISLYNSNGGNPLKINGNRIFKQGGAAAWDNNAFSREFGINAASITARQLTESYVGLTDNRAFLNNGAEYQTVPYYWYFQPGSGYYAQGGTVGTYFGPFNLPAGQQTAVTYDGVGINFWINGTLYGTVPTTPNRIFYAAIGINPPTGVVDNILFSSYADNAGKQMLDKATGRVTNPTIYNTQSILGPSSTTNLNPSYSVGGSNVTVSLPAHQRTITGPSGPLGLYYGSGSGVVAFSTYWVAYIDDPNLTGISSPTIGFSSDPNALLYPGRYQVASGVTPAANNTGGSTGGGGGGGGRYENCVCALSFMPGGGLAGGVRPGGRLRVLDHDDWDAPTWTECQANSVAMAECVRITSASGISLVLSATTPCTLRGGECVEARAALGAVLAVEDQDGFRWEAIVEVEHVGWRPVAHISCNDGTYAAGEVDGRVIFTHNIYYKP